MYSWNTQNRWSQWTFLFQYNKNGKMTSRPSSLSTMSVRFRTYLCTSRIIMPHLPHLSRGPSRPKRASWSAQGPSPQWSWKMAPAYRSPGPAASASTSSLSPMRTSKSRALRNTKPKTVKTHRISPRRRNQKRSSWVDVPGWWRNLRRKTARKAFSRISTKSPRKLCLSQRGEIPRRAGSRSPELRKARHRRVRLKMINMR